MQKTPLIIDMTKLADLYCGLGQVSLSFARTLDACKNLPYDVFFLVKPGQEKVWEKDRKVVPARLLKRYFPALNRNPGLWHALHQDSAFIPASGKFILTIHDLNFLEEKSPGKAKKRLKRLQRKVDKADALCFISQFARESAEKHLQFGDRIIKVIHNGVPEISHVQHKPLNFPVRKFLFNIGVMMPKKNHEAVIRMMKYLPDYDLLIAGGGGNNTYKEKLKQIVVEEGLDSQVFFAGFLTDEEKSYCLNHAEAFVFPSLNEGFGLPVVEAMSVGLPVFCSNKTSLPEVGGKYAFYWENFDPADMAGLLRKKLPEVAVDVSFRENLKKHADQFSWEENLRAYLDLYELLAKG